MKRIIRSYAHEDDVSITSSSTPLRSLPQSPLLQRPKPGRINGCCGTFRAVPGRRDGRESLGRHKRPRGGRPMPLQHAQATGASSQYRYRCGNIQYLGDFILRCSQHLLIVVSEFLTTPFIQISIVCTHEHCGRPRFLDSRKERRLIRTPLLAVFPADSRDA